MGENKAFVQSLSRAFEILTCISGSGNNAKLNEITAATGLNKTTVYRILSSLISLGYVRKSDLCYSLTTKFLELSSSVVTNMDLAEISRPYLKRLCEAAEETVHLVIEEQEEIVYIFKEESRSNSLRMVSSIGLRRPMYCTAVGKSILAYKSDGEIKEIWDKSNIYKYTENTITEFERLLLEIEKIRENGFAMDNEENEMGIKCIAAAIRGEAGKCDSAFSVSGPAFRMTEDRMARLIPAVLEASVSISNALCYKPVNGSVENL